MRSPISAPPLAACPAARNPWASNSGSLKTTATGAYWSPKISNSCWQRDPRSLPCTHTGVPVTLRYVSIHKPSHGRSIDES
jgi:hypothetical protein